MALLEVKGLTTEVSGFRILDNLDFSVDENELRVLLGPNGAGKTTLISLITGQFKPTAGTIHFNGQDITGWAPTRSSRPASAASSRYPTCTETLSVYDNVMISLQGPRKVFQYMFSGVTAADNERIWEILEFVELADKVNEPADTLSHGERQWLELGMLVASNPKLLLLDEPTTGMTDAGKRRTADLIQRIAKNHTVLLVEHDMHLVRQLARKVTVMHQGQLLAEGPLAEVVANELVKAVYLGKGGRR
ncbi:MAG: ATP-binding cassette domain-containing protein [Rhodospirillaceae bacterium]|nr:ATP-binding cassette domain-containing protein [Rhodospirillaceae bacterium]